MPTAFRDEYPIDAIEIFDDDDNVTRCEEENQVL